MNYLLSKKVYTYLKWSGLVALPAIAVFISVVGKTWGWPNVDSWVTTINAAGVLIGTLIGISSASAKLSIDVTDSAEIRDENNTTSSNSDTQM